MLKNDVTVKTELERKFLVKGEIPTAIISSNYIEQFYINAIPEIRLRAVVNSNIKVRKYLTVKTAVEKGRLEYETEISAATYQDLTKRSITKLLCKVRTFTKIAEGQIAQIDSYNAYPFKTVEVEFDTQEAYDNFTPPEWFGEEVTDNSEYKNFSLAAKLKKGGRI